MEEVLPTSDDCMKLLCPVSKAGRTSFLKKLSGIISKCISRFSSIRFRTTEEMAAQCIPLILSSIHKPRLKVSVKMYFMGIPIRKEFIEKCGVPIEKEEYHITTDFSGNSPCKIVNIKIIGHVSKTFEGHEKYGSGRYAGLIVSANDAVEQPSGGVYITTVSPPGKAKFLGEI